MNARNTESVPVGGGGGGCFKVDRDRDRSQESSNSRGYSIKGLGSDVFRGPRILFPRNSEAK